jgi:hypothetical protein
MAVAGRRLPPSAVTLAVIESRRRRGHKMRQDTADFIAAGIQEYCKILKLEPAGNIIAAAAKACTKKAKRSVLNAVNNTFARIKAQSMPLIQDLSDVYREINLREWGCHFSTRRAVQRGDAAPGVPGDRRQSGGNPLGGSCRRRQAVNLAQPGAGAYP